jgi:branched-chain amino acid transport system ATP-binding protein
MSLLSIENLSKDFGGLRALSRVSVSIERGMIKTLIGPNGAGKTTIFNIISCIEGLSKGKVYFKKKDITHYLPYQIASLGIARTFQDLHLFENMTVLENVMTGQHLHTKSNFFSAGLRFSSLLRQEKEIIQKSMQILDFLGLKEKTYFAATSLPYGQQRLLEIARALATQPTLLLLDEPAAGLNSKETDILADKIMETRDRGVTIFIVEHDMRLVMTISDQITVLDHGEVIAEGSPREIQGNQRVIKSYLGSRITEDVED